MAERPVELPRNVLVFVPYIEVEGRPASPAYDCEEYRADIDGWMNQLGMAWEWHAITAANLAHKLALAEKTAKQHPTVVFNLCDGSQSDGYPGLEVVRGLERCGLCYTGADPYFYDVTTSKAASKELFVSNEVRTAPYYRLQNGAQDLEPAIDAVGFPMFVKPDVSAASHGITIDSVCHDRAGAEQRVNQLVQGLYGRSYAETGILAERFIEGREFTVLVVEDEDAPMGLWALPACELVFDKRVPGDERFNIFERIWGLPEENRRLPPGEPHSWYEVARGTHQDTLTNLARRAMRAVKGTGYARVDIRSDGEGENPCVLEVNSQCGLFGRDYDTAGSMSRLWELNIGQVISRILAHALARDDGATDYNNKRQACSQTSCMARSVPRPSADITDNARDARKRSALTW